jgi:hypothetical protein
LGIIADVKKGPRGLFEVHADGEIIYSNLAEGGRLPRKEEIIEKLRGCPETPQQGAPGSGCG